MKGQIGCIVKEGVEFFDFHVDVEGYFRVPFDAFFDVFEVFVFLGGFDCLVEFVFDFVVGEVHAHVEVPVGFGYHARY